MTAPHPSSVILPSDHLLGPAGEHPLPLFAHTDTHTRPQNMMDGGETGVLASLFQQTMTPFTPSTLPLSTVCLLDRSVVLSLTSFRNKCGQM